MRNKLMLICMVACAAPVVAQVNFSLGLPSVDIGINLRLYPELVPVPGYPVYYAPQMDSNYFFYDGMYWVYQNDDWYTSSWYNGPWMTVDRDVVPVFVLRIPVRYYRQAPMYFRGWHTDSAPRWGEHWGNDWQHRRQGWDRWDRHTPSTRPPLPLYQRNYTGDKYPQLPQQQSLQNKNYRYQPHDPLVRQQVQEQSKHIAHMPPSAPVAAMPDQRKPHVDTQEKNDIHVRDTATRDARVRDIATRDARDNPRENQHNDQHNNQRVTPLAPVPHNSPAAPIRAEPQKVAPQVQSQNRQPERERAQEQRQQDTRMQRAEHPAHDQPGAQEANRGQQAEQHRERPNEKSKDRGNEKDDERGHDRAK